LRGHGYTVNEAAPSPDGRTLASNTRDGEVFLWELDKPSSHQNVRRLGATLASAVFTTDSKALIGPNAAADWHYGTFKRLRNLSAGVKTRRPIRHS